MSALLVNLLSLCGLKFFIINRDFKIVKISDELFPIVASRENLKVGRDLRGVFPELIGTEEVVEEILAGRKEKFELKAIACKKVDDSSLYVDICIAENIGFCSDLESYNEKKSLIVLISDVTERMLLEQSLVQGANESNLILKELSASKQYIDQIVDSMADGLLVTTLKGNIKKVNPAALKLLESSPEEIIGQPISKIIKGIEKWKWQLELDSSQYTDGQTRETEIETVCFTKKGNQVPIAFSYSEVETQVEHFQGYVYILRDMSERKQAELAKQEFLAMISHEIRTPIASVIGMANILLETPLDTQQYNFIDTIHTSGYTLLNIINDILDFSKIEAGKLELEAEPFDLNSCVDRAFSMLSPQAKEKGLQLCFVGSPDLPQVIIGDITRLTQILINLINNAIKFTEAGTIEVSIASSKIGENEDRQQVYELLFAVKDSGVGIPRDRLNRLFKAFSQVNSSISREYGGTGLGLAICKLLSELMGGRIWVESELNVGTTFYFTINVPIWEKQGSTVIDENLLGGTYRGSHIEFNDILCAQKYPLNILLVDDYPVNQKLIGLMLEKMGYQPDIANNGKEAIAVLQEHSYDIVLMDIQMPEMDGLTATKHICNQWDADSRPRIIALTASSVWFDRDNFSDLGFDSYLVKPFHLEDLKQILVQTQLTDIEEETEETKIAKIEVGSDILKDKFQDTAILKEIKKIAKLNPSIDYAKFMVEIIDEYLSELPTLLGNLHAAFENNSINEVASISHKFASCSANLGADKLTSLSQDLENFARNENTREIQTKVKQLISEYESIKLFLLQERQQYCV